MKIRITVLFLIGFFSCIICLDAKLETISGKIYEVYANDGELTVSILQPNGNTTQIIPIKVDSETEYIGISNLSELTLDQPIKVEFAQNEKGVFMAKSLEIISTQEKPGENK